MLGMVALLLRFGAEVNARGQSGRTPLHMAVSNLDMVNSLLKEGADPSSQDEKGNTPMHVVLAGSPNQINYNSGTVIDALLQSGCDVNSPNDVGLTSFHKLLDQPTYSTGTASYIVQFLESGASVSICFPDGRTPLQVFLSRSADAWATTSRWDRHDDQRKALSLFLKNGMAPTALTPSGQPLIAYYFQRCYDQYGVDYSWAEELCKLAEPRIVLDKGDSILHLLATKCHKRYRKRPATGDLMHILLRNGADPDHRNQNGETPLLVMFREKVNSCSFVESTVPTLLAYGADPWLQDSLGRCAVFEAVRRFPRDSHNVLKAFLELDLKGQWDSLPHASQGVQRTVWQEWDQAKRASDWSQVERSILDHKSSIPDDVEPQLRSTASSVLAEKHLGIINEQTWVHGGQLEYMAVILRDCRTRKISVDMRFFDRILELCG